VERAGRFVVAIKPDGTVIVADKPVDTASVAFEIGQDAQASKWEDQPG
jgi:hypothetical protein